MMHSGGLPILSISTLLAAGFTLTISFSSSDGPRRGDAAPNTSGFLSTNETTRLRLYSAPASNQVRAVWTRRSPGGAKRLGTEFAAVKQTYPGSRWSREVIDIIGRELNCPW